MAKAKVKIKTESAKKANKKARVEHKPAPKKLGFQSYKAFSAEFPWIKVGEDTDNWHGLSVGRKKGEGWVSYVSRFDRDEMAQALVVCAERVRDETRTVVERESRARIRELEAQLAAATAPKPAPKRKGKRG